LVKLSSLIVSEFITPFSALRVAQHQLRVQIHSYILSKKPSCAHNLFSAMQIVHILPRTNSVQKLFLV